MLLHLLSETQKVMDMSPFNNLQELAYLNGVFGTVLEEKHQFHF